MKKIVITVVCFAMLLLAACSKSSEPFNCGLCGRESTGSGHQVTTLGEEMVICDDCYEQISAMQSAY